MSNRHIHACLVGFTLLIGLALSAIADSKQSVAGTVSYLKGVVEAYRQGSWISLELQAKILPGDVIRTGKKSRVELTLVDESVIRLGSKSKIKIKQALFSQKKQKLFSAEFARGRFYSMVSKLMGKDSVFKVETSNAVAGVRGTTFRIDANQDKSTLVRVYAGAVAVSNAPVYAKPSRPSSTAKPVVPKLGVKPGGPGRREVAGPREVAKKEWEEFIAKAMQEVRVAATGKIGKPVAFDPEQDAADEWVAWNKSRDMQLKE